MEGHWLANSGTNRTIFFFHIEYLTLGTILFASLLLSNLLIALGHTPYVSQSGSDLSENSNTPLSTPLPKRTPHTYDSDLSEDSTTLTTPQLTPYALELPHSISLPP